MSNVPAIFKDEQLQQQFDNEGFVKISLLGEADVAELMALYRHYFPNPSKDFFSSSYENDFELKKEINDAIGRLMLPNLEKVFTNFTWFGSAFLSKGNGPRSEMPMHQDWTIVDESQYVAINIWTPLQETNEENGTLEVLSGSHRWHNALRAPTLPFYYEGFQQQLKTKLTVIPAKPTEAIVLNQAVIHYSKPNTTGNIRVAITTGIKTKNAPMIFHYWNKELPDQIEQFNEEDDFLIRFTDFHQAIFKRPVLGSSAGLKSFKLQKPTRQEVDELTGHTSASSTEKHAEAYPGAGDKKSFGKKLLAWIRG
jgi:hypothetical protein